jgi:hypothetical protein
MWGWLAILENEAGAGMGNESVPHFMSGGVAQYGSLHAVQAASCIVGILFSVGDLVRSGGLKRLKGICP